MALFLLLCIFSLISCLHGSEDVKQGSNILTVYPVTAAGQLVRRMDETLNLTCSVTGNSSHMSKFKITWQMPYNSKNSKSRVFTVQEHNKLTLLVQNLQESDTGDYKCQAVDNNQTTLQEVVRVNVKRRKPVCSENMFQCALPGGECIAKRYVCDGWEDCPEGTDEAPIHCGRDSCEGKLRCDNGRCIPYEWCCDDYIDPNCTVKVRLPCCRKLITGCVLCAAGDMDADGYPPSEQQRFNDMGFLQTTIYTVIGCAMAFMFIVTVLIIAICRVHMKRSVLTRCPAAMLASHTGPGSGFPRHLAGGHRLVNLPSRNAVPPLYDLDVFLGHSAELSQPSHSGLLVTYNINNGVQFVGQPVDPPPYSEILTSPPREGPPPPYTSRENLTQPFVDHDNFEDNPSEGDRLLGTSNRNCSPVNYTSNNTIQVTVENAGESDTLLSNSSPSVILPNYISSVQVSVINPLPLMFNTRGTSSSPESSFASPDPSENNCSSSEISEQPSSSPSNSSLGQMLPSDVSPSGDEYTQDNTDILGRDICSGGGETTGQLCNYCSSNTPVACVESDDVGKMNHQSAVTNKELLDSAITHPINAAPSLATSPTCKISTRGEISDCLVESLAVGGFTGCECESKTQVSDDINSKAFKPENT
ncbi:hypothetical protein R5R35_003921 [Gryllus longicercus]|uniref:Ig-like domain-containing protein n=1 Tax=Gryllus longicercus TaxID=2509291 RepID=A0AAN9VHT5_9ORTH